MTTANSQNIKIGTVLFFSECWDEEYGSYHTVSATVSETKSALYDEGEVLEFLLTNTNGECAGGGYAWEDGARMFGNGDVYLTAEEVPAINCSSDDDDEDQV